MKKIYKIFENLTPRTDYLKHFYWGFLCSLISIILYLLFNNLILILLPSFLIGLLKEYFDSRGNGKAEWLDFAFTIIPSITFTLIIKYF